jgi:hypothetical protein
LDDLADIFQMPGGAKPRPTKAKGKPTGEPRPAPAPARAAVEAESRAVEVLPPVLPKRMYQPKGMVDSRGQFMPFPEVDLNEIEMLASVGMTTKQIADALGVQPGTFGRMQKNDPVITEAVERGVARGVKMVTDSLFQNALKGNVAAQIFFLKNKAGWQDRQELDQRIETTHKMSFEDAVNALKAAGIDAGKI